MTHATHCVPQPDHRPGNRFHPWQTVLTWATQAAQQHWHQFTHPLELRVWHTIDQKGRAYWSAYDPRTGRSFASGSEADMRQWIEQRHRI